MMAWKAEGASGSHCEKIESSRLRVSLARRSCGLTLTPSVVMILSTLAGLLRLINDRGQRNRACK